eukprot:CAMPEP_0206539232 /NCGR_PEP_ID=MMETSP0325_2-20121206/8321_1 /ASSEMBLY_ACC=CAM_ASM_000347 /TAXON_ID=2866 /ORGANISM="Crypthecodinium cohnii, Strain Seligo" /LENGTH=165 /DNA_ID=CAMNT_0054036793 /DNA_START=256 /DNA_END=753 /DNA_ORIENTATION=+
MSGNIRRIAIRADWRSPLLRGLRPLQGLQQARTGASQSLEVALELLLRLRPLEVRSQASLDQVVFCPSVPSLREICDESPVPALRMRWPIDLKFRPTFAVYHRGLERGRHAERRALGASRFKNPEPERPPLVLLLRLMEACCRGSGLRLALPGFAPSLISAAVDE